MENEVKDNSLDIARKLASRIDALRDGTPETGQLVDTILDVISRYTFLTAYISANKDSKDFPKLLIDLVEAEYRWPENTDPDVLALFNVLREEEMECRQERESADLNSIELNCISYNVPRPGICDWAREALEIGNDLPSSICWDCIHCKFTVESLGAVLIPR